MSFIPRSKRTVGMFLWYTKATADMILRGVVTTQGQICTRWLRLDDVLMADEPGSGRVDQGFALPSSSSAQKASRLANHAGSRLEHQVELQCRLLAPLDLSSPPSSQRSRTSLRWQRREHPLLLCSGGVRAFPPWPWGRFGGGSGSGSVLADGTRVSTVVQPGDRFSLQDVVDR